MPVPLTFDGMIAEKSRRRYAFGDDRFADFDEERIPYFWQEQQFRCLGGDTVIGAPSRIIRTQLVRTSPERWRLRDDRDRTGGEKPDAGRDGERSRRDHTNRSQDKARDKQGDCRREPSQNIGMLMFSGAHCLTA